MPAPTVYKSTDTSAPSLIGLNGSLITVLDAVLVNGYGSQSAAGWTKAFSGTNLAAYRQASSGAYWRLDDSNATTGLATANGYGAMTAVSSGTNQFGYGAGGANDQIKKSNTNDSTVRSWIIVADTRTFIMFLADGETSANYGVYYFGDYYSYLSGDAYKCYIENRPAGIKGGFEGTMMQNFSTGSLFGYTQGTAAGVQTSTACTLAGLGYNQNNNPKTSSKNTSDSLSYLARFYICESNGIRGYARGLYNMVTPGSVTDGDTFSGTGSIASRSFLVVKTIYNGGIYAVETTAWDTST